MKFHRKCGGIFSSFLRVKALKYRQLAKQENKVKKVLKKFQKVVDNRNDSVLY